MSVTLWTAADFVAGTGGRPVGVMTGEVQSISIDSRTLPEGAAFFAIKGENFDGHDYAVAALDAGAAVAVVGAGFDTGDHAGPFVVVDDPLRSLERLGIAARARSKARICAITGSVGKTSSKEALRLALGASGVTHVSPSSFNNHWGVPFSLASLPREAEYAVFELGMNHPGEITPLVAMVRPHLAIITNVAPVHIGFFSSEEEIAEAKAEIFEGLEKGGLAVLPADNRHFDFLARRAGEAGAKVVTFGEAEGADCRLLSFADSGGGSRISAEICGSAHDYDLGAPGRHLAVNSLAVLAATHGLGADVAKGAAALSGMSAPIGRGARTTLALADGSALLIDESYNANPVSMAAALAMLGAAKPTAGGRRIAVLGDMLELGEASEGYHLNLADRIIAINVDIAILSGPMMAKLAELLRRASPGIDVRHALTAAENETPLCDEIRNGDVIMVKGSLGSRLGPLVAALKRRYAASASPVKD